METALQLAQRLFAVLDELVAHETIHLQKGCYGRAAAMRQRAIPVVDRLVALAREPEVLNLHPRVAALLERSASNANLLQDKMRDVKEEIGRVDRARNRTTQVAPVYSRAADAFSPRFQAAG